MRPAPAQRVLSSPLMRYAAVGLLATAAHYGLLVAGVEGFAWAAWLGSGLGAVLGAQVAFFGNRRFTFGHSGAAAPAWWRFQATAALGAVLGMVMVAAGVALSLHYLLAQAAATLLVLLVTFVVNRQWSFKP
jgi:putative flippase GtrA